MRILLDECLPVRLAQEFAADDVRTVKAMGWSGKKNGELLRLLRILLQEEQPQAFASDRRIGKTSDRCRLRCEAG